MDEQEASASPEQGATSDSHFATEDTMPPLTILVIDDEPNVRKLIRDAANRAGYTVLTATNGVEAWHLLERNEDIDIVVCDLMMPEMGGFELMRLMNQNARTAKLPLLMLINNAPDNPPIFNWNARIPVRWCISKPFNPKYLLNVIAKIARPDDPAVAAAEDWDSHFKDPAKYLS